MSDQHNIHSVEFHYDSDDPEGFRIGIARIGRALGGTRTGMSIYEIQAGQSICPYHYEYGEEEWLVVVSGRPTLRTPEGERELEDGDVAFFPMGPEGAHKVTNATKETVRVLMFSNLREPGVVVYPDSDKVGINTGNRDDNLRVHRSSGGVGYFDGEV